jgi:arsenate reductase
MKILFLCNANVGRSQAAMSYYNHLHPGDAVSAGTIVDVPGQKLKNRVQATHIVAVMQEHGIDMSENERTQLTEDMLDGIDKIIIMADKHTVPDYLINKDNVEFWAVEDAKDKSLERTRQIRDQIQKRIEDLIQRSK